MKDSRKDKFEEFFTQSLKDYGENPSDSVWEELEHKIPQPSEKKKPFLGWFLMLALLLLFAGGYWFVQNSELHKVNLAIQNQEIKLDNISKEVEKINTNLIERKTESISSNESINTPVTETPQKTKPNISLISKQSNFNFSNSEDIIDRPVNQKIIKTEKTHNNVFSNPSNDKLLIKKEKIESFISEVNKVEPTTTKTNLPSKLSESIKTIESLPSILRKLETKENNLNPIHLVDLIGPKLSSSFEFFNYVGRTYPNIKSPESIYSFNKKEARNFDFGVLYNIQLNQRWELQLGIGYTQRSIGTTFEKSFLYNNESFINTNIFQSENTFQINTNYGRQILTNYFTNTKMNDGQDIAAGDPYSANISLVRTQKYINIPLIIRYNWSNPYKKLRWTVKAGVIDRIYFRVNSPGEVSINQISHPRLQHGYSEVENYGLGNNASRFGLEIILGAGVEYELHKDFSIIFEPMFKTNIWERTQVNPYTLGIYSGFKWTIGTK